MGVAVTTMMIVSGVGVFVGTSGTRTGAGVFVGTSGTRTGVGVGVAVGPRQGQVEETRVGVGVGVGTRFSSMLLDGRMASRTQTGTWSDAPAASGATPMSNRTDSSATVITRGMVHGSISVFLLLLGG
jgi:hypothetical protein